MKRVLGSKRNILLFVAPAAILYLSLVIYPIIQIFYLAFQKTDGISYSSFTGFGNFQQILKEGYFVKANVRSLYSALLCFIGIDVVGCVIAIITCGLSPRIKSFLKTSYLIPFILSISVISQLWLAIYHSDWGLLNTLFSRIGLPQLRHMWLGEENIALTAVMIVGIWWVLGMTILLIYTGITSIPDSYYDAAKVDGANYLQTTRYITLPMCKNIIRTCVIINTIGGFYSFPQIYVMTKGGPGQMTMTVMMLIYREAFSNIRLGVSSAMAAITILECCVIVAIIVFLIRDPKIEY